MRASLLALLAVLACRPSPKGEPGSETGDATRPGTLESESEATDDADADGWPSATDCDDADPERHPGAPERCDEVDNDCDGDTDEDAAEAPTWYVDRDLDGWGDAENTVAACEQPEGALASAGDCDDVDRSVYPGAPEICGDGVLNDCDGDADALRLACARTGTYRAGDLGLPVIGVDAGSHVGSSVSLAGDVDQDGFADLLVGGPEAIGLDGQTGGAFLVAGPLTSNHTVSEADAAIFGVVVGDGVGQAVALWPDAAGDAYAGVLVSARQVSTVGEESGGLWLFYGTLGGAFPTEAADVVFAPSAAGERLGWSLAAGGDLDGDRLGDLAMGAVGSDRTGIVRIFAGGGDLLVAVATVEGAGQAADGTLAARGDVDGDGVADMAVGDPDTSEAGSAYLLLGPFSDTHSTADAHATWSGEHSGDAAGTAVSLDGDADGDGLHDLLVGAPAAGPDAAGIAYLVLHPAGRASGSLVAADAQLVGEGTGDLGASLSLAGDLDGDGLSDLAVGDPEATREEATPGVVRVCYAPLDGILTASAADLHLWGKASGDRLGAALASDGDQDGDGTDDLLIGSPDDSGHIAQGGMAWMVAGRGL